MAVIRRLAQELESERLLESDDAVVVGVSGGPDSMALLHLLVELNGTGEWRLRLHAAHLNHTLRGEEAEQDAAFVQAACDHLDMPCTVDQREVRASAEDEGVSIEELGRRERYAFFERVCLQVGARAVAVGHHADDQAETILHRILRGTGLRGLAGIPRRRGLSPGSDIRLVRPLLRFTRAEILDYLRQAGIIYRDDRSNSSNEAMRNRIRNVLLPAIEAQVNPQARDALVRLGAQARWLEEYLTETVQRTFDTLLVSRTDQTIALNVDGLSRKSRLVQAELIRVTYAAFGLGEQDLSFAHLVAAMELVSDPTSGRRVSLPGGLGVERRYQQLVFSLPSLQPRELIAPEVAIHLPGRSVLPVRRLELECLIEDVGAEQLLRLRHRQDRMEEFIDFEAVHAPLVVRSRRPGDRFVPLGAPGTKKLSDFLADEKVDPKDREQVAILCDQLGPIWVIGYRIDDRVKLTELTRRVLHLRARILSD